MWIVRRSPKYLAPAIAAGITPGGPVMSTAEWAELVGRWFPEITDTRLRQTTWPEIDTHRDSIAEMLTVGVSQATIHQWLRDEQGLQASVASLKRWVAANLPEQVCRQRVTVLGEQAEPRAQAQIDYGHLGSWVDPRSGKKYRVWALVMVLVCSRLLCVRPVLRRDHPKLNRSDAELAEHDGTLIDPARAAKPKDKPRVERPMPSVRDSFWRGREFVWLEHMQQQAIVWCREVAGRRQCRPLGGAAPLSVFQAVEAQALTPLPRTDVVLAPCSRGTVGPDIHVKLDKSRYSLPWHGVNALFRLRAAQGVLDLAGKHGPARLEKACARAIEVGDPRSRTIQGILAARAEANPALESTGNDGAAA